MQLNLNTDDPARALVKACTTEYGGEYATSLPLPPHTSNLTDGLPTVQLLYTARPSTEVWPCRWICRVAYVVCVSPRNKTTVRY